MASELKDFIKTYDGLMEPRFCQRLIDNFEKKEENQGMFGIKKYKRIKYG